MKQKAFRGMEQYSRRMWEHSTVQRKWVGERNAGWHARQLATGVALQRGAWNWSSVAMILSCDACSFLMRRACCAGRSGNREGQKEEFQKHGKISVRASFKVKECHEKVESEDIGRLSIAQDILHESIGFLRRVVAPVGGVGGVTSSYVCPHCRCFPLEDHIWWVSSGHCDGNNRKKKQTVQLVVCGVWRPVRLEGSEQGLDHARQGGSSRNKKYCERTLHRKECATTWSSRPVESIVTSSLEKSQR